MPVARNMKELEKMVLDRMKKELPNATKEYCHKWYNNNSDIKEIVSEIDKNAFVLITDVTEVLGEGFHEM